MHMFLLVDSKKQTMLNKPKKMKQKKSRPRLELTRFRSWAFDSIAFKSSNDLPVFKIPEARVTFNAIVKRLFTIRRNWERYLSQRMGCWECSIRRVRLSTRCKPLLDWTISRNGNCSIIFCPWYTPNGIGMGWRERERVDEPFKSFLGKWITRQYVLSSRARANMLDSVLGKVSWIELYKP